jgi:tetratricopeptide (TPR) repeat protein
LSGLAAPRAAASAGIAAAFAHADDLLAGGQLAAAARMFEDILHADPRHADSRHRLGVIALASGQADAALDAFDAALALRPRAAIYHDSRGDALEALGRNAAAIAAWRTAIRLDPRAVAPLVSLAGALARGEDKPAREEAVQCFRRALALDPLAFPAQYGLGLALTDLRRPAEAEVALRAALRLAPDHVAAHSNLGDVLRGLGRLDEAAASLATALRLAPGDIVARIGLARVHMAAERFDAAEALLRGVLAEAPGTATAHLFLALLLWGDGRYAEGLEHYEWRNEGVGKTAEIPGPNWDGTDLAGRTLLVVADEGYGDFIQFCRYIPLAARQGRVVVRVAPPLLRLVLLMDGVSQVVPRGAPLPAFDLHCSATSLPRAFRAGTQPIPADIPYLRADPADVADWRDRLAGLPGRKVGLVWAGNPDQFVDPVRSIPFRSFASLGDLAGVSFVSLQKDSQADPRAGLVLHDRTDELLDFADTAALIETLDLVIAVDTAVAHLAGALGRPVWLLNRWDGGTDPRWLRSRPDTLWYPSIRIFRQRRAGDWAEVLLRVRAALSDWLAA